jgi:hypothetical protein
MHFKLSGVRCTRNDPENLPASRHAYHIGSDGGRPDLLVRRRRIQLRLRSSGVGAAGYKTPPRHVHRCANRRVQGSASRQGRTKQRRRLDEVSLVRHRDERLAREPHSAAAGPHHRGRRRARPRVSVGRLDRLEKMWDDLYDDKLGMWGAPDKSFGRSGTLKGHINRYRQVQDQLQKEMKKWDKFCGRGGDDPPTGSREWAVEPVPEGKGIGDKPSRFPKDTLWRKLFGIPGYAVPIPAPYLWPVPWIPGRGWGWGVSL